MRGNSGSEQGNMDYYYRKLMGHGAVASKFRLNLTPSVKLNQSNLRQAKEVTATADSENVGTTGSKSEGATQSSASPVAAVAVSSAGSLEGSAPVGSEPPVPPVATAPTSDMSKPSIAFKSQVPDTTRSSGSPDAETSETHHANNCNRCYKLKKKCLREYPSCVNCRRSGSNCEYINRSNKRRKKISVSENEAVLFNEPTSSSSSSATSSSNFNKEGTSEYFRELPPNQTQAQIHLIAPKQTHSAELDTQDAARKLVLISKPNQFGASTGDASSNGAAGSSYTRHLPRAATSSLSLRSRRPTLSTKLNMRSVTNSHPSSNLKDEFINMKPIPDSDLPTRFLMNYFHNYETRFPFITHTQFMKTSKFRSITFDQESIVNLDIYLLLSIGCLLHDKNTNSSLFSVYFSEKNIELIIDVLNFESQEGLNLLLLLILFKLNLTTDEKETSWEMLGILTRQMIKKGSHVRGSPEEERFFWSVYNLDKSISMLFNRPSQLPQDAFIMLELPLKPTDSDESDEMFDLINQEIIYSKLQNKLLTLRLSKNSESTSSEIKQLSSDIEKWRVKISRVIHSLNFESPEEHISLVNLNFYYFLIELDEISASESFQFTLQFLSNSFTLLIDDEEKNQGGSNGKPSKRGIGLALTSLFWYLKLFKVVEYSLTSLKDVINTPKGASSNLKIVEFSSNLQLMINLFKYLSKLKRNDLSCLQEKVELFANQLSLLGMKMTTFLMSEKGVNKNGLNEEINRITDELFNA